MSIESLRDRMAELSDLTALARLAAWDQRTMMPPEGGAERGEQLATLERLAHERATGDEVGEWLAALERGELLAALRAALGRHHRALVPGGEPRERRQVAQLRHPVAQGLDAHRQRTLTFRSPRALPEPGLCAQRAAATDA